MNDYFNVNFDIAYWNDFYNSNGFDIPDWYFNLELTKPEIVEQWRPDSEILVVGAGVSSLLTYLCNKKFPYVTVLDYSPPLIEYLKTVYVKKQECTDWDCKIL